jgi:hypothetical protein
VSFFEPPPPRPEPPEEPPQPPWLTPPTNVLGSAVPVELLVARTDDAAVLVRNVVAYPSGLEFVLAIRLRHARHGRLNHPFGYGPGEPDAESLFRFGVQFADGAKATALEPWLGRWPDEEPSVWLSQHGGSGRASSWDFNYWLWPLPPAGPLAFVAAWPAEGVPETRAEIDAGPVREAAGHAEVLWEPVESGGDGDGGFTEMHRIGFDDTVRDGPKPEPD